MPYLTKQELASHLRDYQVDAITLGDDSLVDAAIEQAIDEAASALTPNDMKKWQDGRPHYDIDAIFSAEGSARNQLILGFVKDLAIYHLVPADNTGADYGVITDRYEKATAFLEKIGKGEKNMRTLPKITAPPPEDELPFAMGSRCKFNHE